MSDLATPLGLVHAWIYTRLSFRSTLVREEYSKLYHSLFGEKWSSLLI